ncbi:hypothetical protein DAPPUDRAFT_264200 [Daphnia pulex]|uniref:Uncharacterized protein n=1 Tax=Daphnia pulex TaxID=6669 RepID=E9HR29_DAPPU|nr:hypothetical protein DAPPUDRAFT_265697 [Daphnia pulex]EFX65797.1 hypothetical protein DAPPUDRAFT_264200 [Daphnia pulex]|eukprot:EFX64824.1 hypothetical protein DAPPUDRAFT_265697 [Daphnia pulex]
MGTPLLAEELLDFTATNAFLFLGASSRTGGLWLVVGFAGRRHQLSGHLGADRPALPAAVTTSTTARPATSDTDEFDYDDDDDDCYAQDESYQTVRAGGMNEPDDAEIVMLRHEEEEQPGNNRIRNPESGRRRSAGSQTIVGRRLSRRTLLGMSGLQGGNALQRWKMWTTENDG